MNGEQIVTFLANAGRAALDLLGNPTVLIQAGVIGLLFVPALLLSWRVEPRLVQWAEGLRTFPDLARVAKEFLSRLEWLFFVLFLAAAYVVATAANWPSASPPAVDNLRDSNFILYAAMVLAAAWLAINAISHVIRVRTIRMGFVLIAWIYVAAVILGVTDDIKALLDGPGYNFGSDDDPRRVSLLSVAESIVVLAGLLWLALVVGNFLDRRIQQLDDLTPSLRVLVGKILRIALMVVAAMVALSQLGIEPAALTVFSGAVGVGIGFGLQKVVSNFVSGIIILMDQSIKPGDTVTLGETFGWIRELRARFVSVITRDGREFLIPNEDFITTEVVNWSFSDKYVRLDVLFGVAYDSDPHEVSRLAIAAASGVDRVEDRPPERGKNHPRPPVCWLTGFGDSSLDFKLRFWISDPQEGTTNIRGKVLLAVWDAFREHGVRIPYPHREVILRRPDQGLPDQGLPEPGMPQSEPGLPDPGVPQSVSQPAGKGVGQ